MNDSASPDRLRVSGLLERLGNDVLTAADARATANPGVAECVLWDPDDALLPVVGGVLLMAGSVRPADVTEVWQEAARLGYAAVVLKRHGRPLSEFDLAGAPRTLRILFAADGALWTSMLNLIDTAITASRSKAHGNHPPGPGGLFALADTIAATAGGAVTIENANREVLGYSNLPEQAIDESRRSTILGRLVPDVPRLLAEYRELGSAHGPVQFHGEADDILRCAIPVRIAGRLLGSVWVLVPAESDADRVSRLLQDIVPVVALEMARAEEHAEVDRARRAEVLASALGFSATEAESALQDLRDRFPVVLMGFRIADNADDWDHRRVIDLLSVHAEVVRSRSICAQVGDTSFILFPHADGLRRTRLAEMAQTCRRIAQDALKLDMRSAYSGLVPGIRELPGTRLRLESALRWLIRPSTTSTVCDIELDYHHVILQDLVESPILAPDRQIPILRSILEHDRRYRTSYARTVLAHLDHGGRVGAASAELSIHENSYRYRLRRAATEFGLDLDDPEITLTLWLQLHAIRDMLP